MKKKTSEWTDEDFYNIKEEDLGEEVKFKIDENSFKGPFTCHKKKTKLENKRVSYGDIEFSYQVWKCAVCKKEYLDLEQAKRYEKFLIMKRFIDDDLITIERNMNFDGKTYFFRLPKELTKNLHKDDMADIKLLSPAGNMFLVEIKHGNHQSIKRGLQDAAMGKIRER